LVFEGDQPWIFRISDLTHGFSGYWKSTLNFWAYRKKFKELSKSVGNKTIVLMPSIISYLVAEKAGADADANFVIHYSFHEEEVAKFPGCDD
jgi:hypothetical protein